MSNSGGGDVTIQVVLVTILVLEMTVMTMTVVWPLHRVSSGGGGDVNTCCRDDCDYSDGGYSPPVWFGATRGVVINTSAFLASVCHQRKSAGSSLGWDLNFRALVCFIF